MMNTGFKPCTDTSERTRLLNDIGKAGFVLTELNLYLDTHPYDQQAMDMFRQYSALKNSLVKEFTEKFGPIVLNCVDMDSREWKWGTQDWPWEGGFY